MKTYIVSLITIVILGFSTEAQNDKKTETFYHAQFKGDKITSIKKLTSKKATTKLIPVKKQDTSFVASGVASFLVNNIVAPLVFNNISKLFYKPENYIKEHSKSFVLVNKNSVTNFDDYKQLIYKKQSGSVDLFTANFSISEAKKPLSQHVITLDDIKLNYSNVKLKRNHAKLNIVIEITVNYFDSDGIIQSQSLDPFVINNIIPKGKNSSLESVNKYRFITNNHPIKDIHFKITEVNANKKHWDTWLELFQDNRDKLRDLAIEQINIDD